MGQNGNVLTRNYTDPFGNRRNTTTLAGDHGFLNKPADTTGLTAVGARYYDPTLGAFVSVDPIMDLTNPQQWNPYTYANNNPLAYWDPSGLMWDGWTASYQYTHQGASGGYMERKTSSYSTGSDYPIQEQVSMWAVGKPRTTRSQQVRVNTAKDQDKYGGDREPAGPVTWSQLGKVGHVALDIAGLIPVVGEPADGVNAAWYAIQRDWAMAATSGASTIPFWGWGGFAAKFGIRGARAANSGFPRMSSTFGSRDKAIENMTKWSARHPQEGYLDVIGHGSPDDLAGMSAAELAAKLRPGLGGRSVRLLSCQTGCPSGSFGQDLANELRVRIQAPTTDIGASGSGKSFDFYDGGEWRWFDPQG